MRGDLGLGRPVDGVGVGAKRLDGRCVGRNHPGEARADAEEHTRVASCPSASGNRPALRLPAACWVVASCLHGARPGSAVIRPSDMRVLGTNHRVRRWCLGQRGASHGHFVRPRATYAATRHSDRLMAVSGWNSPSARLVSGRSSAKAGTGRCLWLRRQWCGQRVAYSAALVNRRFQRHRTGAFDRVQISGLGLRTDHTKNRNFGS